MIGNPTIGILAYGSLIDDPGDEIASKLIKTLDCITPFNVEYARMSKTRDNAPTLIPVKDGGSPVKAKILVLNNVTKGETEDMLWRRETRQSDKAKKYPRKTKPSTNDVVVKSLDNFNGVEKVLYTSIGQNIGVLSGPFLAKLAIESYYAEAGDREQDGLHYLLNAKKNGIHTALSDAYEAAVLSMTNVGELNEAINVLAREKPQVLAIRKRKNDFEEQYRQIGGLVHFYGLEKTMKGLDIKPEDFNDFIKEHQVEFMINVHEGFKLGQEKILALMLGFEEQKDLLQIEKSKLKGKESQGAKKNIFEQISLIEYWEQILRHMIDSIGWQLLRGQLYASRRIYQGVEGAKKLKESNIQSVISVAKVLNKEPDDFALITDLSSYFQIGDILWLSKNGLQFVEVKEGEKSHKILEVIDRLTKAERFSPELFEGVEMDKYFQKQLVRTLKQLDTANKAIEILNTDKGVDKDGRIVKIITPKEETPRFDKQMSQLEVQLKSRNFWAYDVIDECLHVGLYKGEMKMMGPGVLESIAKQGKFNFVLANYRSVIRSLNRPIFSLPFSQELVYDILFDRVDLIFMIDLDAYISWFDKFGLTARWMSRKETAKLLEQHKDMQLFIHKHRCIAIEYGKKTMYVSVGMLQRMFFELIMPSYTAYMTLYYFNIESGECTEESE